MRTLAILLILAHISFSAFAEQPQEATLQSIAQWRFKTEAPLTSSPAVHLKQVYIGDLGGSFYALEASTGKLLWQFAASAPIKTRPAAHDTGVVFAAGGTLYAMQNNGALVWSAVFHASSSQKPLDPWDVYASSPYLDKKTVYIGAEDGKLYGYNLSTGKRIFTCDTQIKSPIRSQPVTDAHNVYFGNWNGEFFACSLRNSRVVWKYDTRADKTFGWVNAIQNRATVFREKVCFSGRHCRYYCLNRHNGEVLNTLVSPSDQWLIGDPARLDNTVVFGTSDQQLLYALDMRSFKTLWQAPTAGRTWGAPWIGPEAVYAINNKLQKFDRNTGKHLMDVALPKVYPARKFGDYEDRRPSSHSDVIAIGDKLIFAIDDGTVLATQQF